MEFHKIIFPLIIFLIAFLTAYLIKQKYKIQYPTERNEMIDGMRGFLALNVFIHHAYVMRQYCLTGQWTFPDSVFYNQLGKVSVTLFFMITGFLFISKILNSDVKKINWRSFFISRAFRIMPMYYVTLFFFVILILAASHWRLMVTPKEFAESLFHWGIFTVVSAPLINNAETAAIYTGVTWTLPFEWSFYFSLPVLSLLMLKSVPKIFYIVSGIFFITVFYYNHDFRMYQLYPFIAGAVPAFLIKYTSLNRKMDNAYASMAVLICLLLISQFKDAEVEVGCIAVIGIMFTLIALGCSLFGLFRNASLKLLGEISYSTYLIHNVILFVIFYFGLGLEKASHLTVYEYGGIIFFITPVLVIISFLTFRFIEKPFMDRAKQYT